MRYNILAIAFSFFLIGLALVISTDISYAQAGGLVPCNGPECNLCDLAQLAENFINFIVQISFVISALLFAIAGFMFFTAGADPGKVTNARKIFTNTFIGIIIILTAWLVVNVILTTLVGQGVNPFTSILCKTQAGVDAGGNSDLGGDDTPDDSPTSTGGFQVTGVNPNPKSSEPTFNFGGPDGDIQPAPNTNQLPGEDEIIELQRQTESKKVSDKTNLD